MSRLREPTADDADALGRVHVRAWQRAYRGGLMPDEYLDNLSATERAAMWRETLRGPPRPRCFRFVIEDDAGVIAGFIVGGPSAANPDGDTGEVYAVNVDPAAWGKGYGRALLKSGVGALSSAGFSDAILWVHPGNARARRFYESLGWIAEAGERRQEVLGVEVPEVRYRRRLDPAN